MAKRKDGGCGDDGFEPRRPRYSQYEGRRELFERRCTLDVAETENRRSWCRIISMTKGYEAGLDMRPCVRCRSRKYWFDDQADEWLCGICVPPVGG